MPIVKAIPLERIKEIEKGYIKLLDREQEIWKQIRIASPRLDRMLEKVQLTIVELEKEYKSLTSQELCEIVEDVE